MRIGTVVERDTRAGPWGYYLMAAILALTFFLLLLGIFKVIALMVTGFMRYWVYFIVVVLLFFIGRKFLSRKVLVQKK